MDERELNRAIDAAAEQMMTREPSRAFSYAVMARVREKGAPQPRRFRWMTAAATAVVLAGVVTLATVIRAPAPPIETPAPAPQEPRVISTWRQPHVIEEVSPPRHAPASRVTKTVARPAVRRLPPMQAAPLLPPLQAEAIVIPDIDLSPIVNPPTLVERIEIGVLTIEPLTASND